MSAGEPSYGIIIFLLFLFLFLSQINNNNQIISSWLSAFINYYDYLLLLLLLLMFTREEKCVTVPELLLSGQHMYICTCWFLFVTLFSLLYNRMQFIFFAQRNESMVVNEFTRQNVSAHTYALVYVKLQ